MPKKVTASTSGIDSATTSPVRSPSEKKHTTSIDDHRLGQRAHELVIERCTAAG